MITIKITNAEEIVKNNRNWFISRIAPYFVNVETEVEKAIVKQIQEVFIQKNIEAEIAIVPDDERPA